MRHRMLARLRADERGETMVEFAIVSVIFFTLMCAVIEYGLIEMTKIAIESATQQVARSSSIDTSNPSCDRACQITTLVTANTHGIINAQNITVSTQVITAASTAPPAQPDVCTDNPSIPYPATCVSWQENNGVPGYQQNNINAGASNDLVQITVFCKWQVLFPIMKPFFTNGIYNIVSTTVVKNEPF